MGGIFGGNDGAQAVQQARQQEAEAYKASVLEQQRQYDIAQELLQPFREHGVDALTQQQALAGMVGTEEQEALLESMAERPGAAYAQEQAEKALLAQAAATGQLGGGNIQQQLAQLAVQSGMAEQSDYYNQLAQLSGTAGSTTQQLVGLGMGTAGNIAQTGIQAGQAMSQSILGEQAIAAQQQQNLMNLLGTGAGLGAGYMMQPQTQPAVSGIGSSGTPMMDWQKYAI